MLDATGALAFGPPDLTVFCRLDGLGLVVTGQRFNADCAELSCRVVGSDRWCRRCGAEGRPRDTVTRGIEPSPRRSADWAEFIAAQAKGIVACDFFHVDTVCSAGSTCSSSSITTRVSCGSSA